MEHKNDRNKCIARVVEYKAERNISNNNFIIIIITSCIRFQIDFF